MATGNDVDSGIKRALRGAGALSAAMLAGIVNVSDGTIRRHCRLLEESGVLRSDTEDVKDVTLLFCGKCKRVVFGDEIKNCKKKKHHVGAFHPKRTVWRLTRLAGHAGR